MTVARTARTLAAGVVAGVLIAASAAVLAPSAAQAAQPTTIAFVGETAVAAPFASDWNVVVAVSVQYDDGTPRRLDTTDGTVDVYASGISGAFATALPIQPDGLVYIAQPIDQPLLAAGSYQLTAIFNPAQGTDFASSQTAVPATLDIAPFAITPLVTVSDDASVSAHPVISASLTGEYLEATGGAPAGTWSFSVTSEGDTEVFSARVAQEMGGTSPVRVEVTSKLASGSTYTVTSSFTPVSELADGIVVSEVKSSTFETPGTTAMDALSTRIPFPWYLVLAVGIVLAGLVTTVVILAVKVSRRQGPRGSAPARIPGDPESVETLSWDEAGLQSADEQNQSARTTWALSDAGDLTERLDVLPRASSDEHTGNAGDVDDLTADGADLEASDAEPAVDSKAEDSSEPSTTGSTPA